MTIEEIHGFDSILRIFKGKFFVKSATSKLRGHGFRTDSEWSGRIIRKRFRQDEDDRMRNDKMPENLREDQSTGYCLQAYKD